MDSGHPGTLLSGVQYNAFGEATSAVLGDTLNGHQTISESLGFDGRGRLAWKSVGSIYSINSAGSPIGYAQNSNLASVNETLNGTSSGAWSYGYDQFNRLLSANKNGTPTISWVYDRFGNRWQQNSSPQYTFDTNNHITTGGYQYDAAGNMTNDTFHSYTYDAEGRITAVDGGATASYHYDAFGRRITIRGAAGNFDYVLDPAGHWITKIHSPDSGVWADELYAGGRHVATYANSSTYFDHVDCWVRNGYVPIRLAPSPRRAQAGRSAIT